ncbi:DUF3016 domain-containing protein [Pseudoalteromonas sp. T1lg75]|uniref:DUF3016 domain-containing protein n=1 Tax=Pseudoalteromonas sp. T1lg75 TaxID=2077102 RepID=UPI000CF64D7F|nr:DUF3016 domain-containing protein [Pseudoalteromonas sp. T1lg75]
MKVSTVLVALLAMAASAASYAGEAKIKWQDLNDYADARPSNEVKKPYHDRLMKKFDKHFNFEAQNLPEGSVFKAEITDLDLAGEVRFGMNEFRVMKPVYIPRIEFSYKLVDKDGKVLSSGDVDIKDMSYMDRMRSIHSDKEFYYDFRLISSWFQDSLYPELGIEPQKVYR